ncbi:DUF2971 domain-containing protein [Polaromonas sp. P2-4]|nr:DUF2971 domain-containing protein [Polaromonas sp. P2-4]
MGSTPAGPTKYLKGLTEKSGPFSMGVTKLTALKLRSRFAYIQSMNRRDTFYKYMSQDTGRIVLKNQTLRWSTPGTLNDPYDIQFDLSLNINREAVKAATLQKMWEAYCCQPVSVGNAVGALMLLISQHCAGWSRERFEKEFESTIAESFARGEAVLPAVNAEVRAMMANSKILCLTTEPDNTLMWTHYAEAHQGMVLRFRTIPELDSPYSIACPIQYLENMPVLMDDDFLSDMLSGRVSLDPKSIMSRLVYTKSSDWAYEHEWRIFSGAGRNPDAPHEDCRFGARELDAVIFGCRTSDADRIEIAALVRDRYPHASLLQARKKMNAFQLEIEPLTDI